MVIRNSDKPGHRDDAGPSGFKIKGEISSSDVKFTFPAQKRRRVTALDAPDRVESDVLIAIQPIHLRNIAARQKNHEYRKYRLKEGVERLWLYETRGTRGDPGRAAITHIAVIPAQMRHTPGTVSEEPHGIGNSEFNAGLKKSKYGYPIDALYELLRPVALEEMKDSWNISAPMGWSYIKRDLWDDRWGTEETQLINLKQIF